MSVLRRPRVALLFLLIGVPLAIALYVLWSGRPTGLSSREGSRVVLRVGSQKGGAKSTMIAADVLKDLPYTIEWSEFPAAQHLLEALSADAIDVGTAGDAPFLFAYQAGAQIVGVQATKAGNVPGASAILVRNGSDIHSAHDLKGKRIATGRGSAGHYLLLRALDSAGLKITDVSVVFLAPGDAKAAFSSGSVDAWSVWPPYVGAALLHGDARIAVDAKGLVSGHLLQVASRSAVQDKREALADFLGRYAKALTWANDHGEESARVLSRESGLPIDVARYSIDKQKWAPVPIDAAFLRYEGDMLHRFSSSGGFETLRPLAQAFDASLYTPAPSLPNP